jgi:hypothetical protein
MNRKGRLQRRPRHRSFSTRTVGRAGLRHSPPVAYHDGLARQCIGRKTRKKESRFGDVRRRCEFPVNRVFEHDLADHVSFRHPLLLRLAARSAHLPAASARIRGTRRWNECRMPLLLFPSIRTSDTRAVPRSPPDHRHSVPSPARDGLSRTWDRDPARLASAAESWRCKGSMIPQSPRRRPRRQTRWSSWRASANCQTSMRRPKTF